MKRFKRTALTVLVLLGFTPFAQAQLAGGLGERINNPIGGTQAQSVFSNLNRDTMFGRQANDNSTGVVRPSTPEKTEAVQTASLDSSFKPGPYTYPAKLAATLSNDAAQQQQAASIFLQLLEVYDQQMGEQDPRLVNNVVGSMVYATYVSYYIQTGIELTEAQQEGLYAALNRTLMAEPTFAQMADAGRQEMYEALVITASFALGCLSNSVNDPSQYDIAEMLSEYILQSIYQHNASELTFTDQGVQLQEASFF